jgi:hypothetical protein
VNRSLRAAFGVLLLLPSLAAAQGRGGGEDQAPQRDNPSTAAERKRAVAITRRLEKDPLGRGTKADRRWLLQWIVAVPDVQVKSCSGPLDPLLEGERQHGRELYAQSVFGMAAYQIEHPGKKPEDPAVQLAGVQSTLKMYQALRAQDSSTRWSELDELVAAQKSGRLAGLVKEETDCGESGPVPQDAI